MTFNREITAYLQTFLTFDKTPRPLKTPWKSWRAGFTERAKSYWENVNFNDFMHRKVASGISAVSQNKQTNSKQTWSWRFLQMNHGGVLGKIGTVKSFWGISLDSRHLQKYGKHFLLSHHLYGCWRSPVLIEEGKKPNGSFYCLVSFIENHLSHLCFSLRDSWFFQLFTKLKITSR